MHKKLLDSISRFDHYTDAEIADFVSILQIKGLKKNDHFLSEGQISREIAFVDQGLLMHYRVYEGEVIPADFAVENEWVAYLKSFSSQTPSEMSIMALEDSVLLVLPAEKLAGLLVKHPKFLSIKNHNVEKALIDSTQHAADLAMLSAKQRYYKLMRDKPYVVERVPQYYLAPYLGMKPQSLSRIRKEAQ